MLGWAWVILKIGLQKRFSIIRHHEAFNNLLAWHDRGHDVLTWDCFRVCFYCFFKKKTDGAAWTWHTKSLIPRKNRLIPVGDGKISWSLRWYPVDPDSIVVKSRVEEKCANFTNPWSSTRSFSREVPGALNLFSLLQKLDPSRILFFHSPWGPQLDLFQEGTILEFERLCNGHRSLPLAS